MSGILEKLQASEKKFNLRTKVPYSDVTSLGAGGTIPILAEPWDDLELGALLKFCNQNGIKIFCVSAGTNLVGMDGDFDGVIIRLAQGEFTRIAGDRKYLTAGCGVRITDLARYGAEHDAGGMAALCGIPGALGGALRMNAGASGDEIGHHVLQVLGFFPDGTIYQADGKDIKWSYRTTTIPKDVVLTVARFSFDPSDGESELLAIRTELEKRRAREPIGRSAGCMFKNVSGLEPAGKLIDECGLKGYTIGAAKVSEKHANFLLNSGKAAERDVVAVMSEVRRVVADQRGFYLHPEQVFINSESRQAVISSAKAPRVLVLYGGTSNEREISLRSGSAVLTALLNAGLEADALDITECRLYEQMKNYDVIYPVLHGGFGEDGQLQKVLEDNDFKFIGSGSVASDLAMDKIATKKLLDKIKIPTAKWGTITAKSPGFPRHLSLPVVLKAPREGSTFGIEQAHDLVSFAESAERLLKMSDEVLVEEFVSGVEMTVPIVNDQLLPPIEIHTAHGFYDFDAKYVYKNGHTEYYCPVRNASAEAVQKAEKYALEFYHASGCRDILRVDFIIGNDDVPYMLEANTLPGCTATSLVPKAAQVAGMSFEKMVSTLVHKALKR